MATEKRALWAVAGAALLTACAPDFVAAVQVGLRGAVAESGGGYLLSMRQVDGGDVGLAPTFVEHAAGEQEVTVLVDDASWFLGERRRQVALFVQTLPGREQPPVAAGTAQVTLERDAVVDATVDLVADPRPLATAPVAITLEEALQQVRLTLAALPAAPGALHLWLVHGETRQWLARHPGVAPLSLLLGPGIRNAAVESGLAVELTLEPSGGPAALAGSLGWLVAQGSLPAPLVPVLLGRTDDTPAILPAMQELIGVAVAHAELAAQSAAISDTAGVRMHAEHVFATVAGSAVAEAVGPGGKQGDLDGDGTVMYVAADRTGLGEGTPAAPGHLAALGDAVIALETLQLNVAQVSACASHLGQAVGAVEAASSALAAAPLVAAALDDLTAASALLTGEAYEPGTATTSSTQTFACLVGAFTALATVPLAPLPPN